MRKDTRVFEANPQGGGAFGDLPEWDLSDLYASDYLASILWAALRREEWGSESLDEHGRYQAVHSVMAQRGWLSTAICHRWAGALMQDHQLVGHRQMMAQPTVIIDVDHLRAFDGYPLSHHLLTLWRDLLKGKWTRLYARLLQDKDPFDAHDHLAMLQLSYPSIRWQAFAWVGPERNDHDHGLPVPMCRHNRVISCRLQW